ncbi:MAG: response regulator [Anaerolinea sp.]|nr:response regulator [Anaerolinea sp.]
MVQLENRLALVVEGDAHSLAVISSLLRDLGIVYKRNTTGANVLEQLRAMQPRPDFILMNLDLPENDGFTVGVAILEDHALADIPIILLGSGGLGDLVPRLSGSAFAGYVSKPLPRKSFGDILRRVLSGEHVWEIAV